MILAPKKANSVSSESTFYIASLMRTQDDRLVLRTVSGEYLASANRLENFLTASATDFDAYFRTEDFDETDGHNTLLLAERVTSFIIYPAGTDGVWEIPDSNNSAEFVLVQFSIMPEDAYEAWLQQWPKRTLGTASSNDEPEEAKEFRAKNEKKYSQIMYIGGGK